VSTEHLTVADWKISTYCGGGGCVGVATLADVVLTHDTTAPSDLHLAFARPQWAAFIEGVKNDSFRR
jgi:hypothetical protein